MEYESIKLQGSLYGLAVRQPIGQGSTAVVENLTAAYSIEQLRPIFGEMKQAGVRNVVLDLSQFPVDSRRVWLAYMEGCFVRGFDFNTRYIGITVDEVAAAEKSFRDIITPKIAVSLDAAVESLRE